MFEFIQFMIGLSGAFITAWFGSGWIMAPNQIDARNCGFVALFGLGMVAFSVLA